MFSVLTEDAIQRDALRKYLQNEGIETRPLFNPVHMMPMYSQNNLTLAVTESIYCRGINLPSWPGLSELQLSYIVGSIRKFYTGN
jgi:perosamine synthetase